MTSFRDIYSTKVRESLRPLTPKDATPAFEIASAEGRLGIAIPQPLRDLYELSGEFEELHNCQDRLLPPGLLKVVDDALVFCEENQNVVIWGVLLMHLERPDPPVYQAQPSAKKLKWLRTAENLSTFLLYMLYRQVTCGLMPFSTTGPASPELIDRIKAHWPFILSLEGTHVYARGGQVAVLLDPAKPDGELSAIFAARTREDMIAMNDALGFEPLEDGEEWG